MNKVLDLLGEVDTGQEPLPQMAALLAAPGDWDAWTLDALRSLSDADVVGLNEAGVPAGVDPRILAVAARPDVGVVHVNFFDRAAFDRFWAQGSMSPHYHRRSFTTRLLRGRYQHLLFDNAGGLDEPSLRLANTEAVGPSGGYALDWHAFHFVMYPEQDTATLTLHTEPQIKARERFIPRSRDEVLSLRDEVVIALEAVVAPR